MKKISWVDAANQFVGELEEEAKNPKAFYGNKALSVDGIDRVRSASRWPMCCAMSGRSETPGGLWIFCIMLA
jgi:hypothetical protein